MFRADVYYKLYPCSVYLPSDIIALHAKVDSSQSQKGKFTARTLSMPHSNMSYCSRVASHHSCSRLGWWDDGPAASPVSPRGGT